MGELLAWAIGLSVLVTVIGSAALYKLFDYELFGDDDDD